MFSIIQFYKYLIIKMIEAFKLVNLFHIFNRLCLGNIFLFQKHQEVLNSSYTTAYCKDVAIKKTILNFCYK